VSLAAKARHRCRAAGTGGVAGNERRTAITGFVLAAATLPLTTRWG